MLLSPDAISALKLCTQTHPLFAERHPYIRSSVDIKPGRNSDVTELLLRLEFPHQELHSHLDDYCLQNANVVPGVLSLGSDTRDEDNVVNSAYPHLSKLSAHVSLSFCGYPPTRL